jgi:spermidine synthase
MTPWDCLDRAAINGGGELRLMQRGDEFSIMLGQIELMNSRFTGSEEALATLTCARIPGRQRSEILIGGLGMGFTLRAALADLALDARIFVAELVPAVIRWARGPMAELFGTTLDDKRVTIIEGDVAPLIKARQSSYDAILLDVDNGPEGLTRESNDRLYDLTGLTSAQRALRPGGVLAVWSSGRDRDFSERLRIAGFQTDEIVVRAKSARRTRNIIWMATNADVADVQTVRRLVR